MKKVILATLVAATFAGAANAGTFVDLYSERNQTSKDSNQGIVVGHGFDFGTTIAAEYTAKKDLDLGVKHTFKITEGFFVAPQANYVFKGGDKNSSTTLFDAASNSRADINVTGQNSNVAKFGLEAGYKFESGLFTSARYRYEFDVNGQEGSMNGQKVVERDGARTNRYDFAVGYNFEAVQLTGKAIYKDKADQEVRTFIGQKASLESKNTTDFEMKATMTCWDGIAPYLQYTNKDASQREHVLKIGAKFAF